MYVYPCPYPYPENYPYPNIIPIIIQTYQCFQCLETEAKTSHHGEKCHFGACGPRPGDVDSSIGEKTTMGKERNINHIQV